MTIFVTATDTDVGKTVACAWLMLHLDANKHLSVPNSKNIYVPKAYYWKPIQSGLEIRDRDEVQRITEFPENRFLPSTYELTQPLSPHEAARRDNTIITMKDFTLPIYGSEYKDNLVIEGAGGVMVPLNKHQFVIDLIIQLNLPTILVCRSGLGTINHTLLSLEAMRKRNINIAGIIIIGEKSPHNRKALEEYGQVQVIAEINYLSIIDRDSLYAIKPEINLQDIL